MVESMPNAPKDNPNIPNKVWHKNAVPASIITGIKVDQCPKAIP